jgi:ATP-dependent DNA helicase RecQ
LLYITDYGKDVMMQRQPCYLVEENISRLETKAKKEKTSIANSNVANDQQNFAKPTEHQSIHQEETNEEAKALYQELSKERKKIALEIGKPAFVVFANKTLQAMANQAPKSLEEMQKVPGVGPVKLERYGKQFLEVIQKFDTTTSD